MFVRNPANRRFWGGAAVGLIIGTVAAVLFLVATIGCEADEPEPPKHFTLELTGSSSNMDELLSKLGSHLPDYECEEDDIPSSALVDRKFECRGPAEWGFSGFVCRLYFEPQRWAVCDQTVPLTLGESSSVCFVETRGDKWVQGPDPRLDIVIDCQGEHTNARCFVVGDTNRTEVQC